MKNKYLYTIIFVGLMLSGLAAPVSAVNLDQTGCENTLFGTWSNNTCTVYSTINTPIDIIIPIQTILELHGSVVTNYINNRGTINIYGTLNNTWFINNTGIINNKCGGTFIGDTPIPNPIVQETPCIYINIDLSPDTASNPIGTEHTVTATVIDASGNTYEGILVIFSIIAGPNSPWNSTGTTNASGKATFTYTGDGGIGTDSIRAFIYLNDTIESDIVTKEWTEPTFNISGFKLNSNDNTGVPGWTITLFSLAPNSTLFQTVNTTTDGSYNFTNLTNGIYIVKEGTVAGWTPVGLTTLNVSINGSDVKNQNFTNTPPYTTGSISGFKINAVTGKGIPGWSITLLGTKGIDIKKIVTTGADGSYTFENLPAGNYLVKEELRNDFKHVTNPVIHIDLSTGKKSVNNNFVNRPKEKGEKPDTE